MDEASTASETRREHHVTRPILIFDFDGTIALGDGPVRAYARAVASELGEPAGFDQALDRAIADGGSLDGYDAVRRAAETFGASPEMLGRAYAAGRVLLAGPDAPIEAPAGLAALLAEVDAERVLVTNAPGVRIPEALEALGLTGLFDRIVTAAGKPDGLAAILDEYGVDARLISIGDIWHNDLAPADARGHATALVGGDAPAGVRPTLHAADTAALIPALRAWISSDLTSAPSRITESEG